MVVVSHFHISPRNMVGVMVAVIFADFCHVLLTTRVGGNTPISPVWLRSRAPVLGGDG